ncbi:response regulator [Egicoccus sp. AB-alg2]|uniref:GGDEF domain-containing response regulator n=1 Tax=Egicoccus sp. AB-alg2 TaxID=3242693 RepID=UPI00359EE9E2
MTQRVLVVDDDADIRAFLALTLDLAGFEVLEAGDGIQALERARGGGPDLVLLDIMMPRLDGMQTLRRLRDDARTSHLPVVMMTARDQREDTLQGLDAGADDYITKPFDTDVLLARVRAALRRADQQRSLNPLSGLPGNERILTELGERLERDEPFALLYVDLDQFKPFNDHYGFLRGDEALRAVGDLLRTVARDLGDEDTFVGHVGGDDFVVILPPDLAEPVAEAVCEHFDALAPTLYDPDDRAAGSIEVPDRRGVPQRYGLLSLSIGVATTTRRDYAHVGEVVTIATEMKRYAKTRGRGRSTYAVDRRRDGEEPIDLEVELP